MDKMTVFFLIVVIAYLLFSYITNMKKVNRISKDQEDSGMKGTSPPTGDSNESMYDNYVVAAAVAACMDGKPHRIKNIILTEKIDEKESKWKLAGRQESMAKRVFFNKK